MDSSRQGPEAVEGTQRRMTTAHKQATHGKGKGKHEDEEEQIQNALYDAEVLLLIREQAEVEERLLRIQLVKEQRLADTEKRMQAVTEWESKLEMCRDPLINSDYNFTDLLLVSLLFFDVYRARPQSF